MKLPPSVAKPTDPAEDVPYLRGVLHGLLDLAMRMARCVHQGALAKPETLVDATVPFDRIARCIRRLVTLATRLAEPPPLTPAAPMHRPAPRAAQRAAADREPAERLDRLERPERLERLERLDRPDRLERAERLDAELDEFAPEFPEDAGQSAAAIIADICRELGLDGEWRTRPWERCTPEDIAALCAHLMPAPVPPASILSTPAVPGAARTLSPPLPWTMLPPRPADAGPEPPS